MKTIESDGFILTGVQCDSMTMLLINGAPTCISMDFAPGSESSVAKGLNDGLAETNQAWAPNATYTYAISYIIDAKKGVVVEKVQLKAK